MLRAMEEGQSPLDSDDEDNILLNLVDPAAMPHIVRYLNDEILVASTAQDLLILSEAAHKLGYTELVSACKTVLYSDFGNIVKKHLKRSLFLQTSTAVPSCMSNGTPASTGSENANGLLQKHA